MGARSCRDCPAAAEYRCQRCASCAIKRHYALQALAQQRYARVEGRADRIALRRGQYGIVEQFLRSKLEAA